MNPDYLRHSQPEPPRHPGERRGAGAGIAAGLAVLVGIVPFIVVLQGFFLAVSHGFAGYAVIFGVALVTPIALSILLGRDRERSGEGSAALGLWLGVLALLVAAVLTVGMDISIGLSGIPG